MGLIYQFHKLIPTLNVIENITLPVLMDRRAVKTARLNELLELPGLQERREHLPNQLSGRLPKNSGRYWFQRALFRKAALAARREIRSRLRSAAS